MAGSAPRTGDAVGGVYQFADVTVDLNRFELQRAGVPQRVEPQVLEVLAYLIAHRDRLVTKQELMDQVWRDRFISDSAVTSRIKAARQATGDDGERQRVIRTVHGRGYRFVADIARAVQPPEPTQTRSAGLVGREAELSALWSSLTAAESGSRQLMLISGEPGIGKTAIVEAFLSRLDGTIDLLGVGQCNPVGAGEPYAPWLDAVFDLAKGPAAAEVLRCLDTLAPGWLLQLPALVDVDHESSLVNRTLGSTPERMLREALGLLDEDMHALHRRCGGNPLFLDALLDTTAERGPGTDLPRSLRELVEHDLSRLQPGDRGVVEAAAVAGIEFAVQLLGSSQEVDQISQRCHALARRDQLITTDAPACQLRRYGSFRRGLGVVASRVEPASCARALRGSERHRVGKPDDVLASWTPRVSRGVRPIGGAYAAASADCRRRRRNSRWAARSFSLLLVPPW